MANQMTPDVDTRDSRAEARHKGWWFLGLGAAVLAVEFILFSAEISLGAIGAIISLAWVVLIIMGLWYLASGFFRGNRSQ